MIATRRQYVGEPGYESFQADVNSSLIDQQIKALGPAKEFAASMAHARFGAIDVLAADVPPLASRRLRADADSAAVFVLFARSGAGTIEIDGVTANIDRNHVVFIPANRRFAVEYETAPTLAFVGLTEDVVQQKYPMLRGRVSAVRSDEAPVDWCASTVFNMIGRCDDFDASSGNELEAVLHSCVSLLARDVDPESRLALLRFEAQRLIATWPALPALDVVTLAGELGVSTRQLHRAFRDSGTSVSRSIRSRRLAAAKALLAAGATVTNVAYAVGFSGPSHLAAWFKDSYGLSPAEYRSIGTDLP